MDTLKNAMMGCMANLVGYVEAARDMGVTCGPFTNSKMLYFQKDMKGSYFMQFAAKQGKLTSEDQEIRLIAPFNKLAWSLPAMRIEHE